MTIDQNTLRRLNKLWKDRHSHDDDTTATELVEIRETISVGSSGAAVSPAYIHLTHNAGQTIAVAGEAISWDAQHPLIDPMGFANPADAGTDNLPLTTVVVPYDGYYGVKVELKWDSHTAGGTVEIRRTRNNNAVRVWPTDDDPGIWTAIDGQEFSDVAVIPALVGDELSVYVDHDTAATKDLDTAQVIFYKVESSTVVKPFYKAAVLASNPVAYWRLDETSGTNAADEMGTYDATYTNSPDLDQTGVMQDGSASPSVNFDGTKHVLGADSAALEFTGTAAFTLEAWVNTDTITGNAIIIQKQEASKLNGWEFFRATSTLYANREGGGVLNEANSASGVFVIGADHHVAATFDGTTLILYMDGVAVGSDATVVSVDASTATLSIGRDSVTGAANFDGRIDEVAIYDRALDLNEILEHYNIGRGAFL